jgi:uncharacterized RDD family membrane protein YckC
MSAGAAPSPGVASPASNGAAPQVAEILPPGSPYSGLATRVVAFAVDVLIIQGVAWTVGAVAAVTASMLGLSDAADAVLLVVGAFIAALWSAGYFVFFWATTGQTPGNRLMQIRVQDAASGEALTVGRSALRVPAAVLSALLLFTGYLLILVDSRRRALHDRLLHSVVVYAPVGSRQARPPNPG